MHGADKGDSKREVSNLATNSDFQGLWQEKKLHFKVRPVKSDGDCGFTALGYTREEGVALLLSKAGDEECRKLVAPEIRAAFIEGTLPKKMQEHKDYKELRISYHSAQSGLDICLQDIKNELKYTDNKSAGELLSYLEKEESFGKEHPLYKKLLNAKKIWIDQEINLDKYCSEQKTYNAFICGYLHGGGWLSFLRKEGKDHPTSTLDVLAREKKIEVLIWQEQKHASPNSKNASPTLECVHYFKPLVVSRTVHIFHAPDNNHYNLLDDVTASVLQQSQGELPEQKEGQEKDNYALENTPEEGWVNIIINASKSVIERKAEAALPDISQDAKAIAAITNIFHPASSNIKVDPHLCCPITLTMIHEPVQAADGFIYEREGIEDWFKENNTSPNTNNALENKTLIPSHSFKKLIIRFLAKHPALKDSDEQYLPRSSIERLKQALKEGDEKTICDLVAQDRRLLVRPLDADTGQRSIHLAAAGNLRSLILIVALLEKRQKGLGLQALLKADEEGCYPIHRAMLAKQPANVLLLLCDWMGNHLKTITPPIGWLQILLLLNTNNSGIDDALSVCVSEQSLMYINFLLQHGANPDACNTQKENMLYLAVKDRKIESLYALLEAKADPNKSKDVKIDALPLAVSQSDHEAVAALRKNGARLINSVDSLLHLAAEQSSTKVADALYLYEPLTEQELEAKDPQGHTPLHRALIKNQIAMVKWLLNHKANVDALNAAGQSALHIAASLNRSNGLMLLLEHRALLTVKDHAGNTALHHAAMSGAEDVLDILLRQRLSADSLNDKGQTARQLAEAGKHTAFVNRHDTVVNELRAQEENELKDLGVLGAMVLRLQDTINNLQILVLRQQKQISDLEAVLESHRKNDGKVAPGFSLFSKKKKVAEAKDVIGSKESLAFKS